MVRLFLLCNKVLTATVGIILRLDKLDRKVTLLMASVNNAEAVLQKVVEEATVIKTSVGNLVTSFSGLSNTVSKAITDFTALISSLQTGQPTQAEIDAAATALGSLTEQQQQIDTLTGQLSDLTQTVSKADVGSGQPTA